MRKRVMLSSAQRWNQRGLTKCLISWQSWTLHKVAVRNMLKKVVLRLQNMRAAVVVDTWRSWVDKHLALRNMQVVFASHCRSVRVASSFDGWSAWSTRRRHVQSICAKSLARLQNLAVSRAWSAWWSLRCLMVRVRGMAI
eukprot:COSAG02_NODE_37825_length_437_cov_0.650888_1_plen_139_part_10